jgi:hypothetical protein
MTTHTSRTLKYFREKGYHADMIERFIAFPPPGHRKDYFGFGDILAFNNSQTIILQSCGQSYAAHLRDLLKNPTVPLWLAGPSRMLILCGWRKIKKVRGQKPMIWAPRIKEITYKDFT